MELVTRAEGVSGNRAGRRVGFLGGRRRLARGLTLAWLAAVGGAPVQPSPAALPSPAPRRQTFEGRAMGTYTRLVLVSHDSAAAAAHAAIAQRVFTRVDSLMSNWTTTSEVARLNREAAVGPTLVHPEVALVIAASLDTWRQSDGAYDITVEPLVRAWGFLGRRPRVPSEAEIAAARSRVGAARLRFDRDTRTVGFERPGMQIDLGGIAKGYSVDVAAESLRALGVRRGLVEISGNMVALGSPPDAAAWRIGIRDPRDRIPYFARIGLRDAAISTSGKYEQFVAAGGRTYGHIMDPRTGRPAEGLISVTVVAPTALIADAWDTPLFVMGAAAARHKAKELPDVAAVLVAPGTQVDTVWVESDLASRFTMEPSARQRFTVRHF